MLCLPSLVASKHSKTRVLGFVCREEVEKEEFFNLVNLLNPRLVGLLSRNKHIRSRLDG